MNKNLRNCLIKVLLVLQVLIFQASGTGLNAFTQGAELATAALRAPVVILAKKAESDKKFKKAQILGATADFIRMTNDLFALYNLYQTDKQFCHNLDCANQDLYNKNWYKWTKVLWIGQDFSSLLIKIKNMVTSGTINLPKTSSENESSDNDHKIDLMLSGFLKKLDLYVLPTVEGAAAVCLSLDHNKVASELMLPGDEAGSLALPLQAIISGSRLLSEMLEAKSGSLEQKFIIACSIIHAVILIHDLIKPEVSKKQSHNDQPKGDEQIDREMNLFSVKETPISSSKDDTDSDDGDDEAVNQAPVAKSSAVPEAPEVNAVPEVPVVNVIPEVPIVNVATGLQEHPSDESEPVSVVNLVYDKDGDLGRVRGPDGKMYSARLAQLVQKDYRESGRKISRRKK